MYVRTYIWIYIYVSTYIQLFIYAYIHTHSYIYVYIYIYIYKYIGRLQSLLVRPDKWVCTTSVIDIVRCIRHLFSEEPSYNQNNSLFDRISSDQVWALLFFDIHMICIYIYVYMYTYLSQFVSEEPSYNQNNSIFDRISSDQVWALLLFYIHMIYINMHTYLSQFICMNMFMHLIIPMIWINLFDKLFILFVRFMKYWICYRWRTYVTLGPLIRGGFACINTYIYICI
jgi:hypothetical protein